MVGKFTGLFKKKVQNAASSEVVKSAASAAPPSDMDATMTPVTPSRSVAERITGLFKKTPVASPGPAEAAATADAADATDAADTADTASSTHPAVVAMLVGPSATSDPSVASGPSGAASGPSGAASGPSGAASGPSGASSGPSGAASGPSVAASGFGKAWTATRQEFGNAFTAAMTGRTIKSSSGFAKVLGPLLAGQKALATAMANIPEPVLMAYLIHSTIKQTISVVHGVDTFVDKEKKASAKGDYVFAGAYAAQAILYLAFYVALFVFAGVPLNEFPFLAVAGLLVSCCGVWASVLMDGILRTTTDTEAFRTSETHDPAAIRRRLLYLHGAVGFAVALLVIAIPMTCPFALSFGKPKVL